MDESTIRDHLERLEQKIDRGLKLLADESEPERGLVFRVKQLEIDTVERKERSRWAWRTSVGAAITALLALVVSVLKGLAGVLSMKAGG